MSKKLKSVRFKQTVKILGREPAMVEATNDGIKSIEFVNDPDTGPGVLIVDRMGKRKFVPASNVNECELDVPCEVNPLAPEATKRSLGLRTA